MNGKDRIVQALSGVGAIIALIVLVGCTVVWLTAGALTPGLTLLALARLL